METHGIYLQVFAEESDELSLSGAMWVGYRDMGWLSHDFQYNMTNIFRVSHILPTYFSDK